MCSEIGWILIATILRIFQQLISQTFREVTFCQTLFLTIKWGIRRTCFLTMPAINVLMLLEAGQSQLRDRVCVAQSLQTKCGSVYPLRLILTYRLLRSDKKNCFPKFRQLFLYCDISPSSLCQTWPRDTTQSQSDKALYTRTPSCLKLWTRLEPTRKI